MYILNVLAHCLTWYVVKNTHTNLNYAYIIQGLSLSTQSGLNNIKTYFSFISICGHFPLPKKKKSAFPTLQLCTSSLCLKSLPISHHNPNHLSCPAESLPILQNSRSHCRPQRTSLLATHYICIYSSINAKLLSPYCIYTQMDLISPSWSLTWLLFNISAWAFLLPK